jgi:predicted exporter
MTSVVDRRKLSVAHLVWLGLAIVSIIVIALRLNITVDLAYFLPEPESDAERVLVDRLGQGPGSQLIFISVPVAGDAVPSKISESIKTTLEKTSLFSNVVNGQEQIGVDSIPPEVWRNRYLMGDIDISVAGIRAVVQQRLADMAVVSDDDVLNLISSDPYLTSVTVMQQLVWPGLMRDDAWTNMGQSEVYLIAETAAPAFETAAQRNAVVTIRSAVFAVVNQFPLLNGVGIYGLELQETISAEARNRSLLATAAIALILLVVYRSTRILFLAGLPLFLGALMGLAAVAALFGQVHGITLAFGFTLLGVAIDYPLHVLSHTRHSADPRNISFIWPTMRLGAFSTIIAYATLAFSGSHGLAQLGCFSAVGLLGALYATRSLLPGLLEGAEIKDSPPNQGPAYNPTLRHGAWLIILVLAAAFLTVSEDSIWTNDLASLTPISAEKLQRDRALRARFGAPDIRNLLAVSARSEEEVLLKTEALESTLNDAVRDGVLKNFQLVTAILPSQATQRTRRARLSEAQDLAARVVQAIDGTPLRSDAFDPFVEDVRSLLDSTTLLTADSFRGSTLGAFVGNALYFDGKQWMSLIMVHGLEDPQRLRKILDRQKPGVTLIDLKDASKSLVERYRLRTVSMLGLGFCLIGLLLLNQIGFNVRLLWVIGTLLSSLVMTTALTTLILGQLSLFNLIAVVLVGGLGLDYALFFSRTENSGASLRNTRHAVTICYLSTFFAFAVLAMSSVPILHSIGVTVAVGVCINFALARIGLKYPAN